MSDIDWSKAPVNATHARPYTGGVDFYRRNDGGMWTYWNENRWDYAVGTDESCCVARPGPWNGEGLPPVGAEFERRFIDHDDGCSSWAWGRVLAHGQRRIFYVDRTGDEWSHAPADMELRPIRTPEQIEQQQRLDAIQAMVDDSGFDGETDNVWPSMEALYNAGYRKVQP